MTKVILGVVVVLSLVVLYSLVPGRPTSQVVTRPTEETRTVDARQTTAANRESSPVAAPGLPITPIQLLENAEPYAIAPTGELGEMFKYGSDFTDLQRQLKLRELRGKVIRWRLPVYEVKASGDGYLIQTGTRFRGAESGELLVGTLVRITPMDDSDRRSIEQLKTGDSIRIKGVIDDATLRHLNIVPAILVGVGPSIEDLHIEPATRLNSTLEEKVFGKAYGKYVREHKCWLAIDSEQDQPYCMSLRRVDRISTEEGDRYYILARGTYLNEEGKLGGPHASAGMIGAFVVSVSDGTPVVIASSPTLLVGAFGEPPQIWMFVQLGASNYWGWQGESEDCHQGYCSSDHHLLAPYGKQIRNLAKEIPAGTSNDGAVGAATGTKLVADLHIDSSDQSAAVFPLKVTVTGNLKGQVLPPKTYEFTFDKKRWTYATPDAWPPGGREAWFH